MRQLRNSWCEISSDPDLAVGKVVDGQTLLVGGFGDSGYPIELLKSLSERDDVKNLTVVSNNAGRGDYGIGAMIRNQMVNKLISTYPIAPGNENLDRLLERDGIEVEVVPQGTLAQRLNAGAFQLGGFLTTVGVGSDLPFCGEEIEYKGRRYRIEEPIRGDVAFIRGQEGDHYGNIKFNAVARNFNTVMAAAGRHVVAEVDRVVGALAVPADIHLTGMHVDSIVEVKG